MLRKHLRENRVKVGLVLLVDQTIVEHAHRLVAEEIDDTLLVADRARIGLKDALHALAQVAQVEDVVRLGRGREEVCAHAHVDLHSGGDDGVGHTAHGLAKATSTKEPAHDLREDGLEGSLVGRRE